VPAILSMRRAVADGYPSFADSRPLTQRALDFAAEHHSGQRRDADRAPFILHPLEVGQLLHACGCSDAVVGAGVLHDIVEDTDVSAEEIRVRFGAEVAGVVAAVTEPAKSGAFAGRKARLREQVAGAGRDALLVYAADKVSKTRELRIALARADRAPDQLDDRLAHYRASLVLLEDRLTGHPLVAQFRFELESLELLPPAR
jgi:(p)ppGpp synthase/HD superfamily hydrolase